jgi:serine protease AprX
MKTRIDRLLLLLLCVMASESIAQTAPGRYWVEFFDKSDTPFSLEYPEAFLSSRSIDRRLREGIGFDERDLPVNPFHVISVEEVEGVSVFNKSKWFNAVSVNIDSVHTPTALETMRAFPFVKNIRLVQSFKGESGMDKLTPELDEHTRSQQEGDALPRSFPYGESTQQIEMLNGHKLHDLGFTGGGVHIAQMDAGWVLTPELPAFGRMYQEGRLALEKDFVFPATDNIYSDNAHGTYVLSIMAGYWPDSLVGSAPDATYYLFRTENPLSEYKAEEDNWVVAAEMCDSLGIDIINSSLGYSEFDDSTQNYTYADMNGRVSRSSRAADIAFEKGILVVNSAGNRGNSAWRYLTAPSDGLHVMAIGAVRADSTRAGFSSFGPSADGRVKPNVVAMGSRTTYAALDSTARQGNGTSFSSPLIAGMAACLKQAFPGITARDLKDAIEKSAHTYNTPSDSLGYGIPDFWKAYTLLRDRQVSGQGDWSLRVFPNPANDLVNLTLQGTDADKAIVRITDNYGRRVKEQQPFIGLNSLEVWYTTLSVGDLTQGHYIIEVLTPNKRSVAPLQIVRTK